MTSTEPVYLTLQEVVELHNRVIGLYGGMPGIRDRGRLESSLAQPMTAVFGSERFPTLPAKAAAYCFFIVRNHPFLDGNKRTGFLAGLHFLLVNGITPSFVEEAAYTMIEGVAAGTKGLEELTRLFGDACRP